MKNVDNHKRKNSHRRKPGKTPGLPPGSLVHHGRRRTDNVHIRLVDYSATHIDEIHVNDLEKLADYSAKDSVSWIRIEGLHDVTVMERIGQIFDLHPLVVEDILHPSQRIKVEEYDRFLYFVVQLLPVKHPPSNGNEWDVEQLSIVLGDGFVLTFHENTSEFFEPIFERLRTMKGRLRKRDSGYLCYTLLDMVVDRYWFLVSALGEKIDMVEDGIFRDDDAVTLNEIHGIKKRVIQCRRLVREMNRLCETIMREEFQFFDRSFNVYFRDLYDHSLRALDNVEHHRESLTNLLEIQMTLTGNRMNEIMKTLTIFSTIFIPLTFIAGIYGMNFNTNRSRWNMPELNWPFGYLFSLGLMIIFASGMILYFKNKKWL